MRLVISALVSVLLGLGLGATPFVSEHLHWNFWLVVPVSGLVLGAAFGALQFLVARVLQARITPVAGALLALVGALAYASTDVGIWLTSSIEGPAGETVRLRDFLPLSDYMAARLSSSSITTQHQSGSLEMGQTATVVSYIADELGALLGCAGALLALASSAAYCSSCSRYRKTHLKLERDFPAGGSSHTTWQALTQLAVSSASYTQLTDQLQTLPPAPSVTSRKLVAHESACPICGQAALAISVMRKERNEWTTEGESLKVEALPSQGPRLRA